MNTPHYLQPTALLDYQHPDIVRLIEKQQWKDLRDPVLLVRSIYNFVKDEIHFGYNREDAIPASEVLQDGFGQCNTKATLLMALFRAVGIPCRIHGFTIYKALQKGAVTGIWYRLSPDDILHSWVEVWLNDKWYILEGVILDKVYLNALQQENKECKGTFCGFGAYTDNLAEPPVEWNLNDTFIQDKGINRELGIFNAPDDFYAVHRQQLNVVQRFVFKYIVRHLMNRNVEKIRRKHIITKSGGSPII